MSSATHSNAPTLSVVGAGVPHLRGIGEAGELERVELAVGQVAARGGLELEDRPAVELVDDEDGLVGRADPLVTQDAQLAALHPLHRCERVRGVEVALEEPAAGGLLGEEHGAPRGPVDPVQTAEPRVLRDDLALAGLQVHDRDCTVAADLVGADQVAPGAGTALVLHVHVGQVVDPVAVDVQHGLVGDELLGETLGGDQRDVPVVGLHVVRRSRDRVEGHRPARGAGGAGETDDQDTDRGAGKEDVLAHSSSEWIGNGVVTVPEQRERQPPARVTSTLPTDELRTPITGKHHRPIRDTCG